MTEEKAMNSVHYIKNNDFPEDCKSVLCIFKTNEGFTYYSVGYYVSEDDEWAFQSIDLHTRKPKPVPKAWVDLPTIGE